MSVMIIKYRMGQKIKKSKMKDKSRYCKTRNSFIWRVTKNNVKCLPFMNFSLQLSGTVLGNIS